MKIPNCSPLYVKDPHDYHQLLMWYLFVIANTPRPLSLGWSQFEADEGVVRTHWRAMVSVPLDEW